MIAHTLLLSLSLAACWCKIAKGAHKHYPAAPTHYPVAPKHYPVAPKHYPAAPKLNKLTASGGPPYGIIVEWEPVEFNDRSPNSGYKVKMWKSAKVPVLFQVGGIWKRKFIPEQSLHAMPSSAPVEQMLGVHETKAVFKGIKLDADYQVRVQAVDRGRHGQYSNALSIKLVNPKNLKKNKGKLKKNKKKKKSH